MDAWFEAHTRSADRLRWSRDRASGLMGLEAPRDPPPPPSQFSDRNFVGVAEVPGTTHTAIARKILTKARASDTVRGDYYSHSSDAYKLFTRNERARAEMVHNISAADWRSIVGQLPPVLGSFRADEDRFVFAVPDTTHTTGEWRHALLSYTGLTEASLRGALQV